MAWKLFSRHLLIVKGFHRAPADSDANVNIQGHSFETVV